MMAKSQQLGLRSEKVVVRKILTLAHVQMGVGWTSRGGLRREWMVVGRKQMVFGHELLGDCKKHLYYLLRFLFSMF